MARKPRLRGNPEELGLVALRKEVEALRTEMKNLRNHYRQQLRGMRDALDEMQERVFSIRLGHAVSDASSYKKVKTIMGSGMRTVSPTTGSRYMIEDDFDDGVPEDAQTIDFDDIDNV